MAPGIAVVWVVVGLVSGERLLMDLRRAAARGDLTAALGMVETREMLPPDMAGSSPSLLERKIWDPVQRMNVTVNIADLAPQLADMERQEQRAQWVIRIYHELLGAGAIKSFGAFSDASTWPLPHMGAAAELDDRVLRRRLGYGRERFRPRASRGRLSASGLAVASLALAAVLATTSQLAHPTATPVSVSSALGALGVEDLVKVAREEPLLGIQLDVVASQGWPDGLPAADAGPPAWPYMVPALALADAVLLKGAGWETLRRRMDPERHRRVVAHEAGHVLVAFLLGCPVQSIFTSAWDGLLARDAMGAPATTRFVVPGLADDLSAQAMSRWAIGRFAIVLMAGVAAEAEVLGNAEGGGDDEATLRQLAAAARMDLRETRGLAAWAAANAVLLIRQHQPMFAALNDALVDGGPEGRVARAVAAMEVAAHACRRPDM